MVGTSHVPSRFGRFACNVRSFSPGAQLWRRDINRGEGHHQIGPVLMNGRGSSLVLSCLPWHRTSPSLLLSLDHWLPSSTMRNRQYLSQRSTGLGDFGSLDKIERWPAVGRSCTPRKCFVQDRDGPFLTSPSRQSDLPWLVTLNDTGNLLLLINITTDPLAQRISSKRTCCCVHNDYWL